jgi:starch phosphorylase
VTYSIQFYGQVIKEKVEMNGLTIEKSRWVNGEKVKAMAYDTPVPGYNTFNTNCLRLWSAMPCFDAKRSNYHCQTDDDYINLVEQR